MNGLNVPGLHNLITHPPVVRSRLLTPPFSFNWLSASGTLCFLACGRSRLVAGRPEPVRRHLRGDFRQLVPDHCRLHAGTAYVMNYSGMTSTLGLH